MKKLSATDPARRFSDILDALKSPGETATTGLILKKTLRAHRPDAGCADELRQLRASVRAG